MICTRCESDLSRGSVGRVAKRLSVVVFFAWIAVGSVEAAEPTAAKQLQRAVSAQRFLHFDATDPYYVSAAQPERTQFPKLVTPQWIGEEGVEAVVILSIDDMRDSARYEAFLRPILERLKEIDGRAALSIMANETVADDPRLASWLQEGLSLEVHTLAHPCPLLAHGDLPAAQQTYHDCVDLLAAIPGNHPVAYRMPCCDSQNTMSPRFISEIFSRTSSQGNYLTIDSSVFNIFTSNDPELPRELTVLPDGTERFRRYLPFPSFVNTIENYPYPYLIGNMAWEFPCAVPSDWEAQNIQRPNNPRTVEDWQAVLDATVIKQGVMTLVFHPHNWIRAEQVVELVDYADQTYGGRVKFLNFREAHDRLQQHLLDGAPVRAESGSDAGVRLADLNDDGYLDVIIGSGEQPRTRIWDPTRQTWSQTPLPVPLVERQADATVTSGTVWGVIAGEPVILRAQAGKSPAAWTWRDDQWQETPALVTGLTLNGEPLITVADGVTRGVRLLDLDADGTCELVVANPSQRGVLRWDAGEQSWRELPFALPEAAFIVDEQGRDRGLRLVDLNDDLRPDCLISHDTYNGCFLFEDLQSGWSQVVLDAAREDTSRIPPIVRGETNNGSWLHSGQLWVQNEDTARLPDLVDRLSIKELIAGWSPRPKSLAASLVAMKMRDGMTVEIVAAEPLLTDPVGFDFGPDGKLWVLEMGDYPVGVGPEGAAGGRVRYLEDTDGDGVYDRSTLLIDDLWQPTAIATWRDGALVMAPPDILYVADTNGDGTADVRETLFTGLQRGNPQHQSNGLWRGLDGWFYCANGHAGGTVVSTKTGHKVGIGGRDFCIQPDLGLVEALIGPTQFVRSRDAWGSWFGNDNINPMWQYVVDDRYLRRNPHVVFPPGREHVSLEPGSSPVFARSQTLARFNDLHTADRFTSACGSIIYRDQLLGPALAGNSFVSEPVHNLVHRENVWTEGLRFRSDRPADEKTSEFMASTDSYFRPTLLRTGPDGALWVADMYRLVIEHPEWIPEEAKRGLDLRDGADRGRIYRVRPVGVPLREVPRFDQLPVAQLVQVLCSPNGQQRDLAQAELVRRRDEACLEPLRTFATEGESDTARLQALYTLSILEKLSPETVATALADSSPGVRRHALQLAEPLLADHPAVGVAALQLVDDADPFVQQQLAYSLGAWASAEAGRALAQLALRAGDDPYQRAAVLSSAVPNIEPLVEQLVALSDDQRPTAELVAELMSTALGTESMPSLAQLLAIIVQPTGEEPPSYEPWQLAAMAGLLDSLDRARKNLGDVLATAAQAGNSPQGGSLASRVEQLYAYARRVVREENAPLETRLIATRLMGRGLDDQSEGMTALAELIEPQVPVALQRAALETLSRLNQREVPRLLLERWRGTSPQIRGQLLDVVFTRAQWHDLVLDFLDDGTILPHELDATRRGLLLQNRRADVRERAAELLANSAGADRTQILQRYEEVHSLSGDPLRGRTLFEKSCAACHKLDDIGHAVGPDLKALTDKSSHALLVAIIDPNRAIEAQYVSYIAITTAGRTFTGMLAAETTGSVTLRGQDNREETLLRSELDILESSGKSLMPEGLEQDLAPQQMADLIAFLQSSTPEPKQFPGNQPAVVEVDALRGEYFCLASNAEVYGDTLVYEPQHANLGFWQSTNDHAVWTINVQRPGRYAVMLEWASPEQAEGRAYTLELGDQRITATVKPTGSWNDYHRETVGYLQLDAGPVRLGLRSAGPVPGHLLDLKSITLRPGG